jgi:hypothetical protein
MNEWFMHFESRSHVVETLVLHSKTILPCRDAIWRETGMPPSACRPAKVLKRLGVPDGICTRVTAVKAMCLDVSY